MPLLRRFHKELAFSSKEDQIIIDNISNFRFYVNFVRKLASKLKKDEEIVRRRVGTLEFRGKLSFEQKKALENLKKRKKKYRQWTCKERKIFLNDVELLRSKGITIKEIGLMLEKRYSRSARSLESYYYTYKGLYSDKNT